MSVPLVFKEKIAVKIDLGATSFSLPFLTRSDLHVPHVYKYEHGERVSWTIIIRYNCIMANWFLLSLSRILAR